MRTSWTLEMLELLGLASSVVLGPLALDSLTVQSLILEWVGQRERVRGLSVDCVQDYFVPLL